MITDEEMMALMAREHRTLVLPEGVDGDRVDSALTRVLGLSRTVIARLLDDDEIRTNGKSMQKSERVVAGQVIEILMPDTSIGAPIPMTPLEGLSVVYDDEAIVVINKPVGCAAHPSPGWTGPTVVGALTAAGYSVSTSGAAERAGIVHRLDVGTSGLMVVAKTDLAYTFLKAAFKNREVEKIYHALVQGHMDPSTGTIDAPIDRHPKEDYRFAVVAGGKASITHYEVLEFFRAVSLVKVELETGRTHQIRVHFSALRHPLVGDLTYGADPTLAARLHMSRPWLHALELRFHHPVTNIPLDFRAPYPEDLTRALALLESSART